MNINKYIQRNYKVLFNEKFALQEYEGRIRDIIFDDISELNKISVLIGMFLLKYHTFILSRDILYKELKSDITLIFYNESDGKNNIVKSIKSSNINLQYGPDEIAGVTSGNNIVLYVPIKLGETSPFISKSLNNEFIETIKNDKSLLNGLEVQDTWIKSKNFDSIDNEVKQLKIKYYNNVEDVLDSLSGRSKNNLGVNRAYILQTLKHELTHVLDNKNNTKSVNHFGSGSIDNYLQYDEINKDALYIAVNILYMLWSKTEFNAFTQTFSDSTINKRDLIKKDRLERISTKYLSRPLKSGEYENIDSALKELQEDLNWLNAEFGNDNILWEAVRDICIDGSFNSTTKEKFSKMNWERFKNYFIHTSEKLMKKLKEKTIKNVASQKDYDRDIINLASNIKDSVENAEIDDNVVSFSFDYKMFFKKLIESHKVYIDVEAIGDDDLLLIAKNSMIHINIADYNVGYSNSAKNLLGNNYISFSELIKEIIGKKRKSYINKLCILFAEDLYDALNKLEK